MKPPSSWRLPARIANPGLVAAACWLLGGCASAPLPDAPMPPPPAHAWNSPAPVTAWPTAQWWHELGSSELDRLIADAETTNDDLAAAQARLTQANAQARIAGADLLPQIGADIGGGDTQRLLSNGAKRRYASTDVELAASWQVDVWGRASAGARAARATAQAAQDDLAAMRMLVIATVARAYLDLKANDDQIACAQAAARSAQALALDMDEEARHGIMAQQAVAQQRILASQAEGAIPPLQASRVHLVLSIALLTGHSPEGFSVHGGALDALTLPPVMAGLPAQLLIHRPDVAAAERALAAAGGNIDAARRALLPSIDLTASGGVASVALNGLASEPTSVFDFGAGILAPIFDGGRLKGQVRLAQARYVELAADYRKAVLGAMVDVEDALSAERYARLADEQQDAALADAQRVLEATGMAVHAGTLDRQALWHAQAQAVDARSRKIAALLARTQGLVSLYAALGGGWTVPDAHAP
nr:efflux transporter outer membrane subunit [Novosphingobium sp. Fuku2-ISO-50]